MKANAPAWWNAEAVARARQGAAIEGVGFLLVVQPPPGLVRRQATHRPNPATARPIGV